MNLIHIAAECYPAAKAGGLGDVVGALPKYLNQLGIDSAVVIPKYANRWITARETEEVFEGKLALGDDLYSFKIEEFQDDQLGFALYFVNLPGLFDRPHVYEDENGLAYPDEMQRYLAFQKAVLLWLQSRSSLPALIHCHDHHTGLIPFMVKYCYKYESLKEIPTVFTIHNAQYQGTFSWEYKSLIPEFDEENRGLIEYHDLINPLAAGIKNCWKLTTVSPSHFEELKTQPNGLEWLFHNEAEKSIGILNGIDTDIWDPKQDQFISRRLKDDVSAFKKFNKSTMCRKHKLDKSLPLFVFIGRLVYEKGVELIPDAVQRLMEDHKANFIFLGTGKKVYEDMLQYLGDKYPKHVRAVIAYDEQFAHSLYAAADFLIMPSRVEPCGLNQMYAMKYATVPVVRSTGGLKDSVLDISERGGYGIRFDNLDGYSLGNAMWRGIELHANSRKLSNIRKKLIKLDFSWQKSAKLYARMYLSIVPKKKLYDK